MDAARPDLCTFFFFFPFPLFGRVERQHTGGSFPLPFTEQQLDVAGSWPLRCAQLWKCLCFPSQLRAQDWYHDFTALEKEWSTRKLFHVWSRSRPSAWPKSGIMLACSWSLPIPNQTFDGYCLRMTWRRLCLKRPCPCRLTSFTATTRWFSPHWNGLHQPRRKIGLCWRP